MVGHTTKKWQLASTAQLSMLYCTKFDQHYVNFSITISTEFNDICTNRCMSSTKCRIRKILSINCKHSPDGTTAHNCINLYNSLSQNLRQYSTSRLTCSHVHENWLALLQASKAKQHVICCDVVHWDGSSFFIRHAFGQQFTQVSWYTDILTPKTEALHARNPITNLAIISQVNVDSLAIHQKGPIIFCDES